MPFFRTLTLTSVLALSAGPALADLTPTQVWDDWQSLLANYGSELSFERTSNDGNSISIIGLTATFPVVDGSSVMELGTLTFADNGDGSVTIEMEDDIPISVEVNGPDGAEGAVSMTINQPGAQLVASGTPDKLHYDFNYPVVGMTDFTIEGPDVPEGIPLTFEFAFSALEGFVALEGAGVRSYSSDSTIGLLSMIMDFQGETDEEGSGTFNLMMKNLTQTAKGTIGTVSADMSLSELIQNGTSQTGTGSHGEVTYELNVVTPDGSFEMAAAATSGEIYGNLSETGIAYGGVTNDVTMSIGGSSIPLPPLTFRMAQTGGDFAIPLIPGEDPQTFAMTFSLVGLEIDNMLWGMIDPAGALPRDPITFMLDTSGKVIVTEDFTAPEYAESGTPSVPGSIEELNVNTLKLSIAGAELIGDGAFTFDNSMGMPAPVGVANLMLTGGNGLLDTLVGMGLVPEEQAMGARMMLGLFARPGEGEDTLESTIEFNEDGSILANGQRIR